MKRKTLLRLVGTLTLLTLLVVFLDLDALRRQWSRLQWQWWLAAFGCYVLAQFISSVRWLWLAQPLGIDVPWRRYLKLYFVGTFYNQLLPTSLGGDVVRAWNLSDHKSQRGAAFLSVFADRLSGLGILVLMACVTSLFVKVPTWAQAWIVVMGCGMVVALVVLGWLLFAQQKKLTPVGQVFNLSIQDAASSGQVENLSCGETPSNEGEKPKRSVVSQLKTLLQTYHGRVGLLTRVALFAFIIQTLNVILVWMLTGAVGIPVSLKYCFVLVPLVTLMTLLPVSFGGLGTRETGTILLLAPLMIAREQAVTLSLLWLSVFSAVGLVGGVVYVFGSFSTWKGQPDDGSVDCDSDQGRAGQSRSAA